MRELGRLERFLRTDPRDVGCDEAMAVLHTYVDLVTAGEDAAGRYPGSPLTCWPAVHAARTSPGSSWRSAMANAADNPGGAAGGREVLAFDLYGTLVDPLALSRELGQVLGDCDGREAVGSGG
jgi:hypothetical protein